MTREEVLSKFGNMQLYFDSYYKFVFVFIGQDYVNNDLESGFLEHNLITVTLCVGGESSDIYKLSISGTDSIRLKKFMNEFGYSSLTIDRKDKDGNKSVLYSETRI